MITTNSDGDPGRRELLLMFLGTRAQGRSVMDPGEAIIRDRLTFGELERAPSDQCD